jgi:hypothetical protein
MTRVIRNCQSKKYKQYNGNQKLSIKEGKTIQWQFLITIVLSGLLWLTVSNYHCIVWPSLNDSFWLLLSLYFLAFFDWQFLITLVIIFSGLLLLTVSDYPCHCNVWPSLRNCQSKKARKYNDKSNQKLSFKEAQTIQW